MGQRVNIQYSIEIESLEGEVSRLLNQALDRVRIAHADFGDTSNVLSVESTQQIDYLRTELSHVDQTLADANRLIAGYLSYNASLIDSSMNNEKADSTSAPERTAQLQQQSEDVLGSVESLS